MPISISLGLTVLTFIFTLTQVPLESVALKLFTGIEKFEIMAIPFFILAGNFLTHGGVARRMINFATSMVGHLHGGLGLAGDARLRAVRRGLRLGAGDGRRDRLDPAAGDGQAGLTRCASAPASSPPSGALGILMPPSIAKVMYAVSTNTSVGALFIAGILPGSLLAIDARRDDLVIARARTTIRASQARNWAERLRASAKSVWGLLLVVIVIGGIYSGCFTPTEAAAMARCTRSSSPSSSTRTCRSRTCRRCCCDSANMSAMLLYIITNAVLFSFVLTNENIPQAARRVDARAWASAGSGSCSSSTSSCCSPATSWSRRRSS